MSKKILHIVLFFVLTGSMHAQQLPLYSQYSFNRFAINPAYAGNKNRVEAVLTHRNHMMNFPGAPTTQLFSVTAPWQKKYMGFGLKVMNDNIGVTNHLSVNAAANYFIGFGEGRLSMGLEFGVDQYSVKWDQLEGRDVTDAVTPAGPSSIIVPNGAFGLFYTTESFYAGYSIQNMVGSRLNFQGTVNGTTASQYMHHYINAGGVITLNDKFQVEPFALVKAVYAAPWQLDLGSYIVFKNAYGAGVTFRSGDALAFSAKMEFLEQIYVGYSYEVRINNLSAYTPSSHEIMLGYYYKLLEPARKKIIHPRYYF
ncbi:MAG: type IX secretion system membrane protein PorP/SprF [Bacteroidetes bacterium]|nr:type IX secretion system membrane protein PorP/SprF [Bacteroidota bacterium]